MDTAEQIYIYEYVDIYEDDLEVIGSYPNRFVDTLEKVQVQD